MFSDTVINVLPGCLRSTGAAAPSRDRRAHGRANVTAGFHRRAGLLCCEDLPLDRIAAQHGTPAYVYSRAKLRENFLAYQQSLADRAHLICYAVKANSNLALLAELAQLGSGFDIVSGGELSRVMAAGGDPAKVVFSGVGKSLVEMEQALRAGIRCFNIESESELDALAKLAERLHTPAPISIRVNPNVDAQTHPYISTGLKENKFGVDAETALGLYRIARDCAFLHPVGIDCHIGSQIIDTGPFEQSIACLMDLIDELAVLGIELRHIDVGGGLGVAYSGESTPGIAQFTAEISRLTRDRHLELVLEPGRSIVANAGALLTQVTYLKRNEDHRFAIVDAAMNDLLRPALYDAWQDIQLVEESSGKAEEWDVVGPVCETGDFLGKQRSLSLQEGSLLAVLDAGAYGFSMASNYNSRPRPVELLVDGDTAHIIGERESVSDLWARERLAPGS